MREDIVAELGWGSWSSLDARSLLASIQTSVHEARGGRGCFSGERAKPLGLARTLSALQNHSRFAHCNHPRFGKQRSLANSVVPIATTGDVSILVLPGTINGDLAFVLLKGIASRFSLAVGDFRSGSERR